MAPAIRTFALTTMLSVVFVLAACSADDRPAASSSSSASSSSASSSSGDIGDEAGVDGRASSSSSGDPRLDASTEDAAPTPVCANVAREGPNVEEVRLAQDPPAAAGGILVPGKYFLTTWETYAGASGTSGPTGTIRRTTLIVAADRLTFASRDVEEQEDLPIRIESIEPPKPATPTTLETVESCPLEGRPLTRNFTVSGTELVLFEPFGVITRRLVFTKQ